LSARVARRRGSWSCGGPADVAASGHHGNHVENVQAQLPVALEGDVPEPCQHRLPVQPLDEQLPRRILDERHPCRGRGPGPGHLRPALPLPLKEPVAAASPWMVTATDVPSASTWRWADEGLGAGRPGRCRGGRPVEQLDSAGGEVLEYVTSERSTGWKKAA